MNTGELRFDGRVALVTGAGRGMGRAHAELLASRGARVVVADAGVDLFGNGSDDTPARATVDAIRAAGGEAVPWFADLTDESAARGAIRAALDTFGRLDILVHNAGFTLGGMAFEDESLDRLDRQLAINTRAAYALAQEVWPQLQAQGHGRIVLASSTALYGMAGSVPYSTAKSSYLGLTRSLAGAGRAHDITVNAIAPAGATRMAENLAESEFRTWFLATMRPELVSPLVAVLAHDSCTVTGETFIVGGGRVARLALAETRGYRNPELTPEDLRDNLAGILADTTFDFPRDTADASSYAAECLGFPLSEPVSVTASPPPREEP